MVTLIEGDGIGPEISQSVIDIFAAAKVRSPPVPVTKNQVTAIRLQSNGNRSMSRPISRMEGRSSQTRPLKASKRISLR